MKAFSPEMFTEQAQASLRQEAYNILEQKPMAIRSVLEAEDDSIMMEMQARREMYISLLESQQQGLGIIDEAGLGGKMIAAIIAGIIAIITALIAMITGSGSSGGGGGGSSSGSSASSSSSVSKPPISKTTPKKSAPVGVERDIDMNNLTDELLKARDNPNVEPHVLTGKMVTKPSAGFERGMNDPDAVLTFDNKHDGDFMKQNRVKEKSKDLTADDIARDKEFDKAGKARIVFNPLWGKYNSGTHEVFLKAVKSHGNVEVKNPKFPDLDLCAGNITAVKYLVDLTNIMKSAIHTIVELGMDYVAKADNENSEELEKIMAEDLGPQMAEFEKKYGDFDDNINFNFDDIKESLNNAVSIDPFTFLSNDHFKNSKQVGTQPNEYGKIQVQYTTFPKPVNLIELRKSMQGCIDEANKITYAVNNDKQHDMVKSLNEKIKEMRKGCIELANVISSACRFYRDAEVTLLNEIDKTAKVIYNEGRDEKEKLESSQLLFDVPTSKAIYEYSSSFYEYQHQMTDNDFYNEMSYQTNAISIDEMTDNIADTLTRASILTHKYQMRAMNEEALIFSENISDYEKFQRLQAVNEALADKVKRGWYNAVAAVKEIFRKFTEKLTANFTTTKNYMDRYKNIILNADFNPNDTYKTQDLDKGIDRIYDDMVIKLNFNDVVTTDFSTVGQCFNIFFTKGMGASAGPNVKIPGENASIGDINEYFKTFFCMQGNDHTYTGKEFQQHIKKFYDFLYDIRKINKSIKDGIREVEDNANRIMKQAGLDVNKPAANTATDQTAAPQTAPAAAQPAPAAESVYSILYQKYFTLNENGVLVEADINNAGSGTNRAVNNVGKGNTEDDTQTIRNTEKGTVDTKVKAYTDICVSMLKAKMSACEFIRNELMQIIRNHVQAHIGNKAANPQQPQQQQNQNQQQQPQQPQQQAQQQTQQAKPTFTQRVRSGINAFRGR